MLWVIIVIVVLLVVGIIALARSKKSCSCIGVPCGSTNECGEQCCDSSKGQKCVGGKCCDPSCEGLSCADTNGCGESCKETLCGNKSCYKGNCCTKDCSAGACTESCGEPCPCPNPKDVCHNGSCCTPDDCSTGICGNDPKCGQKCTCQNDYCPGDGCCVEGKCTYKNICQVNPNDTFGKYLQRWAKFCQPTSIPNEAQCLNCDLENALFAKSGNFMSVVPISGTISCQQCLSGNKYVSVDPVKIDPAVNYYSNVGGKIVAGPLDQEVCKNQPGGCDSCVCLTSADCTRWGCDGYECDGLKCVKKFS